MVMSREQSPRPLADVTNSPANAMRTAKPNLLGSKYTNIANTQPQPHQSKSVSADVRRQSGENTAHHPNRPGDGSQQARPGLPRSNATPSLQPRHHNVAVTPKIFTRRPDASSFRSIPERYQLGASAARLPAVSSSLRLRPPSSCSSSLKGAVSSPSSLSRSTSRPSTHGPSSGRNGTSKSLSFEGLLADAEREPACESPSSTTRSARRRPQSSCGLDWRAQSMVHEGRERELRREAERLRYQNAELMQQLQQRAANNCPAQTQTEVHPHFGELVLDLGFKRVYCASARQFVNSVPLWSRQRPCNEGRIEEIVRAKSSDPKLMGSILCFEFVGVHTPSLHCAQPVGIFDGQHRARAALKLLSSEHIELVGGDADVAHADFPLTVEVYPVRSDSEIKSLYLEVNKGESVKEIDLPDAIAPARKLVIDATVEGMVKRWPEMFKPSERCRPPHLHKDTVRNRLFQHPATAELTGDAGELLDRIIRINAVLSKLPKSHWPQRVHRALDKAKANGCFLGLDDYRWMDRLH